MNIDSIPPKSEDDKYILVTKLIEKFNIEEFRFYYNLEDHKDREGICYDFQVNNSNPIKRDLVLDTGLNFKDYTDLSDLKTHQITNVARKGLFTSGFLNGLESF